MTLSIFLVLTLLAGVVVSFSLEKIPVDITTLFLLCALVVLNLLPLKQAFAGFSSEIVIVLGSIFVLSGALIKTGVMDSFGTAIQRIAGNNKTRVLLCLMPATSFVAAFMHNTTTTAVFLPAVLGLSKRTRISPGQILIPFAFASMMGGTCMLFSSSVNIAASGYMRSRGLAPIGLFEFLPVGLVVIAVGIVYLLVLGPRLLPETTEGSFTEEYNIREYLSEVVVTPGSPLVGQSIRDLRMAALTVLAVQRGREAMYAEADTILAEGDQLIVKASREGLLEVKNIRGLEIVPDLHLGGLGDLDLAGGGALKIVEAIVMPQSMLVGRTLRDVDFRRRFGLTVIAIHRRGQALPTKIRYLPLRVGDVLLLQGNALSFDKLSDSAVDLWVLEETAHHPAHPRQRLTAVGIFAAAVAAAGTGWVPLPIALLLGALGTVVAKLITPEEAYKAIHWRLLILIAGMTAFGTVMESSGTAAYLARQIVAWGLPLGVPYILLGFALLTMLLTQPMSNAAAALVVLPVAITTAMQLHVQPRTFAIVVTLTASISYITPFEPSCLLVYGPGKYRFRDFLVVGAPLSLLLLVVLMLMVPFFWPLR
jgi:di/tricarboxylate transporter